MVTTMFGLTPIVASLVIRLHGIEANGGRTRESTPQRSVDPGAMLATPPAQRRPRALREGRRRAPRTSAPRLGSAPRNPRDLARSGNSSLPTVRDEAAPQRAVGSAPRRARAVIRERGTPGNQLRVGSCAGISKAFNNYNDFQLLTAHSAARASPSMQAAVEQRARAGLTLLYGWSGPDLRPRTHAPRHAGIRR
jgi:hypothetical protein